MHLEDCTNEEDSSKCETEPSKSSIEQHNHDPQSISSNIRVSEEIEEIEETPLIQEPEWRAVKKKVRNQGPINPPTIEQLLQLEDLKRSRTIKAFYVQPWKDGEAIMVDTWKEVVPWWVYFACTKATTLVEYKD